MPPNTTVAFDSVEKIMRDVNHGWLLRYMHANGASFFFIAVYLHIVRGLYYGSYKAPREILWILGVVIYLLMMATGFMGYVLPWGQMSFWGATVITGFFTAFPLRRRMDPAVPARRLCGRQSDAEPLLLAALPAAVHDRRRRHPARLGAACDRPDQPDRRRSQVEDRHRAVHALCDDEGCVRRVGLPDGLSPGSSSTCRTSSAIRTTTSMANPLKTPAHIVPEWYFLPFYAMLRAITFNVGPIDSKLGGVLVMFGSIIVLFFLPWLDTSKVRSAVYRPWYKLFFWLFVVNCHHARLARLAPAEGLYIAAVADRHALLLRLLPGHHAAARSVRNAAAHSELDHRSGAGKERQVCRDPGLSARERDRQQ